MKVIGFLVVGSGEADRYLEATLKEFKRLCDDAIIVGNNTDPKTEALVKKYGYWFYRDDREWGKYQPDIKTDLLAKVARLNPDWILPLDADEVLDSTVDRAELERLAEGNVACYFYIVNLWNEEGRYARGLSFWNIRFYKFMPEYGLQFLKKPVHCGLAPPFAYKMGRYVPHLVKHYGLMRPEDRQKKIERYQKYDPRAVWKASSYYEALASEATGSVFNEEEVMRKVGEETNKMKYQKTYG